MGTFSEVVLCVVAVVAEDLVGLGVSVLDDELPCLAVVSSPFLVSPSLDVVDREEGEIALSATGTFPSVSFVNLVFLFEIPCPVVFPFSFEIFCSPFRLMFGRTALAIPSPFSGIPLASWTDVVVSPLHISIIPHPSPQGKASLMPSSSAVPFLRPAWLNGWQGNPPVRIKGE